MITWKSAKEKQRVQGLHLSSQYPVATEKEQQDPDKGCFHYDNELEHHTPTGTSWTRLKACKSLSGALWTPTAGNVLSSAK